MHAPLPLTRDLVLIGGGHTHALVLRRWGMDPLPGVRLTLINPEPTAAYSGMLPGHVAGHYPREALEIDLVRLARFAGARLVLGYATGIDRDARRIEVPGRAGIRYDIASVDIGITSAMADLPGFTEHAHPAKPLGPFAEDWAAFVEAAGAGRAPARVAVIGGGVAGVELSLAMAHRLGAESCAAAEVTVIEAAGEVLRDIGPAARRTLLGRMARAGITVKAGAAAARVCADGVELADGSTVAAAFIAGAAGSEPHGWLAGTGLVLHRGFITVNETLRAVDDASIFAVGDCAHLAHDPRPKAGVFAVRQAPVLGDNLRAALTGGRLSAYHPQRDYLKLISTGNKSAVADKFALRAGGAWLWRLKDRIDRKFMAQFESLPAMRAAPLPAVLAEGVREALNDGKPLCGGCGAKVGADDLAKVLRALPAPARDDVLSGPGDDAAVLRHGDGTQALTTDHLRAFTEDAWLLARIAAIHAMGDIWAMGAEPQAALASIILPRMSAPMQEATLAEIMHAATEAFRDAGADLVGGHTSLGAEMTLGFTLTGLADGPLIAQDGAKPGDALILTKAIGTGTVLAGEMAGRAKGAWVAGALRAMSRPQGEAARLLRGAAHAMTDVTGFGLAGHLLGLCDASGVGARLDLAAVPLLDGAETLAAMGVRSTLWGANAAHGARVHAPATARGDLLFDPQTSGGLLASVPRAEAEALLAALIDLGETAAIIGEVTRAAQGVEVL